MLHLSITILCSLLVSGISAQSFIYPGNNMIPLTPIHGEPLPMFVHFLPSPPPMVPGPSLRPNVMMVPLYIHPGGYHGLLDMRGQWSQGGPEMGNMAMSGSQEQYFPVADWGQVGQFGTPGQVYTDDWKPEDGQITPMVAGGAQFANQGQGLPPTAFNAGAGQAQMTQQGGQFGNLGNSMVGQGQSFQTNGQFGNLGNPMVGQGQSFQTNGQFGNNPGGIPVANDVNKAVDQVNQMMGGQPNLDATNPVGGSGPNLQQQFPVIQDGFVDLTQKQ